MAQGVNRVTLIGNLGQDPVIRVNPVTGKEVCSLSIATTTQWKDTSTGKIIKKTEWHTIVLFGSFSQTAKKYLQKGSKIYIEGYISHRKYIDKKGAERKDMEIICTYMQMLDGISNRLKNGNSSNADDIEIMGNNKIYENEQEDDDSIPF